MECGVQELDRLYFLRTISTRDTNAFYSGVIAFPPSPESLLLFGILSEVRNVLIL